MKRRQHMSASTAFVAICTVFVAVSWFVLQPTRDTCSYSEEICAIENLDVKAAIEAIPDPDVTDVLRAIAESDRNDQVGADVDDVMVDVMEDVMRILERHLSVLDPSD